MKHNIKRIPLLFLFFPIIVAAVAIVSMLDFEHRRSISVHLQNNAKHLIYHIGEISRQPLYHRQYGELKQALWDFADKTDLLIENVVLYDKQGEFVVALNLNDQVMNSTIDDFPAEQYLELDGIYHAYGVIALSDQQVQVKNTTEVLGHIKIEFVADSMSLLSTINVIKIIAIVIVGLILSVLFWRHRYGEFHRQLGNTSLYINDQVKGYKQSRLKADSFYYEINQLQHTVMALVGSYEKRLTMKQFEVGALEQSLQESANRIEEQKELSQKELQQQQASVQMAKASALFTAMYQVVFQRLQAKFAVIEHAIVDYHSTKRLAKQQQQTPIEWSEQAQLVDASNQLNQLLCEIKRLADSASGVLRQPVEYIPLSQLINSISHFVIPVANQKSLEFVVSQPDHPIDIEVDVNQLQQVMIALMQSAVANSQKGYIKLTVEVLPINDDNGKEHSEMQLLCCKVLDSGSGLTDMQVAMLANDDIDPKLAEDNWIDEGLRLMVAKTIVKSMGGDFNVRSLNGLGAEIMFGLKCKVSHSSPQDLASYNGCDILIYDPVVESGTVIYDKLCEHGMLAVHCKRLDEIEAILAKGAVQCMISCRPVAEQAQQIFDQSMMELAANHQIEHCLIVSAKPDLPFDLPSTWLLAEKPFVLTSLLDYFHPHQDEQPTSLQDNAQSKDLTLDAQNALLASDKIQILAVDDNETNLKLLSIILKDYPVNLVQALSGREALMLAQRQSYDLILMDKEMPTMSGIETSLSIRQIAINQDTAIVMFSAHVDDEERREMLAQDINDVIEKPLDEAKFYKLMNDFCAERWQQVS